MRITRNQIVTGAKAERARQLRQTMTPEERTLWQAIRNNALSGLHFRRQQVIAGYIVDFYCASAGLAIELDGLIHAGQHEYDSVRDRALSELGIQVLRLHNSLISHNLNEALNRIREYACRISKSSLPSPFRERGWG
jgi:very-short-patch-repair endonuclease